MTPSEIVSFIKERDGKLTDEEREMLSAICRAKIAQCDQALAAGADLVSKLQVIVDEPYRPWRQSEWTGPLGMLAFFLVGLFVTAVLAVTSASSAPRRWRRRWSAAPARWSR
jgi:hypothetical protein